MFKSIFLKLKNKYLKAKYDKMKSHSAGYVISCLERSNFQGRDTRQFANYTAAQKLKSDEFKTLLEKGPKYIVNFFLVKSSEKHDLLDAEKVKIILDTKGLEFLDRETNQTKVINDTLEKAKYIISSDAILSPDALASLLFNKELALTALVNRLFLVYQHNFIAEAIAVICNVSTTDVKMYCANPGDFKDKSNAFSKIDYLFMDAVRYKVQLA
jgi:hypothetical protein